MRDDYTLLTPENVELRYDVAGVGSRLIAALIDYTVISFAYLGLLFGGSFLLAASRELLRQFLVGSNPALGQAAGYAGLAIAVLLAFFAWWGYFVLFEVLWNGQTPGKRLLGLRVVVAGGQPVNATASLVRNVLRAVDLPVLLGVVVMLIDSSSRRLGDFAAGTLVVREPRAQGRKALVTVQIPEVSADQVGALSNAGQLTMAHYTLARDFFARRDALGGRQSDALARRLADDLAAVLAIESHDIGDPGLFIATAARAFEARHRYYDGDRPPDGTA